MVECGSARIDINMDFRTSSQIGQSTLDELFQPLLNDVFVVDVAIPENIVLELHAECRCTKVELGRSAV